MTVARPRVRGFVQPEIMILIVMVGVGAALVLPGITRMIRHEPIGTGTWIGVAAGVVLLVLVPVLMVKWGWLRRE
jgi:hypothetical protein